MTIEIEIRSEDLEDRYVPCERRGRTAHQYDGVGCADYAYPDGNRRDLPDRSVRRFKNRERAMKMLRSKLYERKIEEQQKHLAEIRGEQSEIAWGSQIRSYVFHPYSMVKDHRTSVETGNVGAVMDGDIGSVHRWIFAQQDST